MYVCACCKVSGKPPKVNEEHFHQHFKLPEHNGMDNWIVSLIDRADNRKELSRRESFWEHKTKHILSSQVKERNVPAEYE